MIIADTSGLLAAFNDREPQHKRVRRYLDGITEPLSVSPYVLAELAYLISTRIGVAAELAVLRELTSAAYELAMVSVADLGTAADIVERYRESNIGLTDASLVVLAARYRTHRILTLDHRHFHALRAIDVSPSSCVRDRETGAATGLSLDYSPRSTSPRWPARAPEV